MRSRLFRFVRVAPVVMSLLALGICFIAWSGWIKDPPHDEGLLGHSFQLLMAGQLPLMMIFLVMALRRDARRNLTYFILQVALFLAAWAAVGLLKL
jgi:hypothetical protein